VGGGGDDLCVNSPFTHCEYIVVISQCNMNNVLWNVEMEDGDEGEGGGERDVMCQRLDSSSSSGWKGVSDVYVMGLFELFKVQKCQTRRWKHQSVE